MLESCLDNLYLETKKIADVDEHVILLNHYPIDKEENNKQIKYLANKYNCTLIDSGSDLGLHKSLNNACKILNIQDDDTLIVCDPDDRPTPNFAKPFKDVIDADKSIAVLGCNFWVIEDRFKEGKLTESVIAGHRVWTHKNIEMYNLAAYNYSFIRSIGGFNEPLPYYGGLECYLYSKFNGLKMAYLADVRSDNVKLDEKDTRLFDPRYRAWKTRSTHGGEEQIAFEDWLKKHG